MKLKYYEVFVKELNGYMQFNDYATAVAYCDIMYIDIKNIKTVTVNI